MHDNITQGPHTLCIATCVAHVTAHHPAFSLVQGTELVYMYSMQCQGTELVYMYSMQCHGTELHAFDKPEPTVTCAECYQKTKDKINCCIVLFEPTKNPRRKVMRTSCITRPYSASAPMWRTRAEKRYVNHDSIA